jgi:small subunit ribosomal protein S20
LAHHKSALKRIKTSEAAKVYNRGFKKRLRNAIKSLYDAKDQNTASEILNKTVALIDKMAARHIIHKNKAAHQKSKLMRYYNSLA